MKWLSAKQTIEYFDITNQTLYNWRLSNKIEYKVISKRKFLYNVDKLIEQDKTKKSVAYSRVSNSKQKDDLLRQEESIRTYALNNGIIIDEYYKEIASGMNEDRQQFNKLLDDIFSNNVNKVYITYKDRLTRFGFKYFENIFKLFGCEIIILNNTNETTFEDELTSDLISIIHHFSMKMYSNRRTKLKEISKQLKDL